MKPALKRVVTRERLIVVSNPRARPDACGLGIVELMPAVAASFQTWRLASDTLASAVGCKKTSESVSPLLSDGLEIAMRQTVATTTNRIARVSIAHFGAAANRR